MLHRFKTKKISAQHVTEKTIFTLDEPFLKQKSLNNLSNRKVYKLNKLMWIRVLYIFPSLTFSPSSWAGATQICAKTAPD